MSAATRRNAAQRLLFQVLPQRARREIRAATVVRIWQAGTWRLVHSRDRFARRGDHYADQWRVERRDALGWLVVSRHRTRAAAEAVLQQSGLLC